MSRSSPDDLDLTQLALYLQKALPLSGLQVIERRYFAGSQAPGCGEVNSYLLAKRLWDLAFFNDVPLNARYYGMFSDAGGFQPGCAAGIPGFVASGPTGLPSQIPAFSWDTDGTYGDWYGAHELAHAWGRPDAPFCGAEDGAFPYENGRISPTLDGVQAIYGFDAVTRQIHPPDSGDVMSFCPNVWVSDFTYGNLLDFYQTEQAPNRRNVDRQDRLLVVGTIDPDTNDTTLQPLFILPDSGDLAPRTPGDYAIVLRDGGGNETSYPFTPEVGVGGAGNPERNVRLLFVEELVPYVADTVQVDVVGPAGLLRRLQAGAAFPGVTVLSPTSGQVLDQPRVTVQWMADDADGDPLVFDVQYSTDRGASWEMIEQNLAVAPEEGGVRTFAIDAANLARAEQVVFRVLATDGIHTGMADSGVASKPNGMPEVEIEEPEAGETVIGGRKQRQGIALRATAQDEGRDMRPEQIEWFLDNLERPLGSGNPLVVATEEELGWSPGCHVILCRADDGDGGTKTASVEIFVKSFEKCRACTGDCNCDGRVDTAELVTMVGAALDRLRAPRECGGRMITDEAPFAACRQGDADQNRRIEIHELTAAVGNSLGACP